MAIVPACVKSACVEGGREGACPRRVPAPQTAYGDGAGSPVAPLPTGIVAASSSTMMSQIREYHSLAKHTNTRGLIPALLGLLATSPLQKLSQISFLRDTWGSSPYLGERRTRRLCRRCANKNWRRLKKGETGRGGEEEGKEKGERGGEEG